MSLLPKRKTSKMFLKNVLHNLNESLSLQPVVKLEIINAVK